MKRLSCSNSPAALISICASTEEQKVVYSRELPTMMEGYDEEEACLVEECGQKKRRLSVDQVKALEKSFDLENKLEPDRKVKLAQELGLQPRQVAVWFQNRRARWKTKQLERDYGVLKANYDSLKQNLESLQTDNEALIQEIRKLRSKLEEENPESMNVGEKEGNPKTELPTTTTTTATPEAVKQGTLAMDFKDAGPSDSDSSAILCAYDSPKMAAAAAVFGGEASAPAALLHHPNEYEDGGFEFLNLSDPGMGVAGYHGHYQVKMEEHNFLSEEAPCSFFSEVDQAAILPWYNSENWT